MVGGEVFPFNWGTPKFPDPPPMREPQYCGGFMWREGMVLWIAACGGAIVAQNPWGSDSGIRFGSQTSESMEKNLYEVVAPICIIESFKIMKQKWHRCIVIWEGLICRAVEKPADPQIPKKNTLGCHKKNCRKTDGFASKNIKKRQRAKQSVMELEINQAFLT